MAKNIIAGILLKISGSKHYIGVFMLMLLGFLVALLYTSCQSKELDFTSANCDVALKTSISYSKDVFPIIRDNCLSCHDAKNHSGGIVIENFDQIATSAKIGELMNSITPYNGNPPMMPKGGRLTDCQLAIIKNWINQGINNN